jgi:hypothetical protein
MSKRVCLFCGATPVSLEHAIPEWVGDVLPGEGRWVQGHAERLVEKSVRRWTTDGPDLKCKVPCQTCNSGWMSQLEDRAKPVLTPLLEGSQQRLEAHDLELISYWALKTALMLDRCSEAGHQNISAAEYAAVYKRKGVLPSTHVWLGKCQVAKGSWFQARTVKMDPDGRPAPGYGTTLWIGHLVIQIISIDVPSTLKIVLKPDLLGALAPIWPRGFKLDWPTTTSLSLEEVVQLGDRIAVSGITMGPY